MIDLEKYSIAKYFLFSSLYFSEGLKWSIAVVIFPLYFNDLGISATILGLVIALTGLPTMSDILTAMNGGASYEAQLVVEGIGSSVVCSSR